MSPEQEQTLTTPALTARQYHQLSKHSFQAYARGPETLDWDDQPDPFRRYDGAELIELPLSREHSQCSWADLWRDSTATSDSGAISDSTATSDSGASGGSLSLTSLEGIGLLLQWSLALSAWKQFGNARWSLRVNPSSGNLHPTESWILVAGIDGLLDGVYHYRADLHALERRCGFTRPITRTRPEQSPQPQVLLGFSSVLWREGWKYGERAYRYCQHDVGHALAAVSTAARVMGCQPSLRPVAIADHALATMLGLDRQQDYPRPQEYEHPDCLLALTASADVEAFMAAAATGQWSGQANVLDRRPMYQWPVLQQAAEACQLGAEDLEHWLEAEAGAGFQAARSEAPAQPQHKLAADPASRLLLQRRSAQQFNPSGSMALDDFLVMLDHLLVSDYGPWQALPLTHGVELILYVHQVEGLAAGLYALIRNPANLQPLQQQLRSQFEWQRVEQAPSHLPLYRLMTAGARRTAAKLQCQQGIAGESCFSISMLADFSGLSQQPWRYRQLHWLAGAIGQQLYLEAEACGVRGTGIGCFFDDPVQDLLGLQAEGDWQVIYGFTVGEPLLDHRVTRLPPYQRQAQS